MKILLIDTCGTTGTVALADTDADAQLLGSEDLPERSASEQLTGAIRGLAARCGVGLAELDAVVVVHGPGSFTGVRVGLSATKGLCEALNLPLVAVSRLAVLAGLAAVEDSGRVYAVLDAGRGEFYVGVYEDVVCVRESLLAEGALLDALRQETAPRVVTCEAAVAAVLAVVGAQLVAEPVAMDALELAVPRIHAGDFDDVAEIDANYLRRTDAEILAKMAVRQSAADAMALGDLPFGV
jgi:tRNA threonylcarbamoyladenosine biosynthesis protein TsaB